MRPKLDTIEDRLRKFIESSVQLLPGSRQQLLANKLVSALRETFVSDDPQQKAPGFFTIYMNPENISFWENRQALSDALAQVLRESAQEAGLQFTVDPIIMLAADQTVAVENFRVVASNTGLSGYTGALSVEERRSERETRTINAYLILDGYRSYPLHGQVVNIGRRLGNHIVIDDPRVSRSHTQVRAVRGQYILFDLNSTGGTFVNGLRISQHSLKPGDVISLAGYTLIYGEDNHPIENGNTRAVPTSGPEQE